MADGMTHFTRSVIVQQEQLTASFQYYLREMLRRTATHAHIEGQQAVLSYVWSVPLPDNDFSAI